MLWLYLGKEVIDLSQMQNYPWTWSVQAGSEGRVGMPEAILKGQRMRCCGRVMECYAV